MSSGLIALLDDVAAIAKVAAASIDDVAAQSMKAGAKAAGIVIDDAAVTPRYVLGFTADRELPIIRRIAWGSLRNKLFFLLPAALALSFFAPWAITPLLVIGGLFLCYEGFEKVHEVASGHGKEPARALALLSPEEAEALEEQRVQGAIKTDLILSAEIMAMTLAVVSAEAFWQQAAVLGVVAVAITAIVYGGVALIVKADDFGLALASADTPATAIGRLFSPVTRRLGRIIVTSMPGLLTGLGLLGTAAMLWVGGGIIVHGLETMGFPVLAHGIHAVAEAVAHAAAMLLPAFEGAALVMTEATGAGLLGLALGFVVMLCLGLWRSVAKLFLK